MVETAKRSRSLKELGIESGTVHWDLPPARLYEESVARGMARIAADGPLVVDTTPYTGRSPKDKFIVRHPDTDGDIAWGKVNAGIDGAVFDALYDRVRKYLSGKDLFVQDLYGGADKRHRLPIRVVSESPWASMFARTMFVRIENDEDRNAHKPEFTIVHAPFFEASPERDGTNSEAYVLLNLTRKIILIGGTKYAGEIKKSIFTLLNYLLPQEGRAVDALLGQRRRRSGDAALFFGLSGTGKTTLSADPQRTLIGDDEHGWSDDGVFNFEGGCYAKVIRLVREHEPEIYATTESFGTILENVVMDDETRVARPRRRRHTENTRAAYPITQLPNIVREGAPGIPQERRVPDRRRVRRPAANQQVDRRAGHVPFPVRLYGQGRRHRAWRQGAAGGLFGACFGEPFLPLHPSVYAKMLGEKIREHRPAVWLVNTGWTSGAYGSGHRIPIPHTRAMVTAALAGTIDLAETVVDPVFGVSVPRNVPGVPDTLLTPRETWDDKDAFDRQAAKLAAMFRENFKRYETRYRKRFGQRRSQGLTRGVVCG